MRESDGEPKNNPGSFVPFCHTARPHAPCPRCVPVTRHVQDSTCCPHPQFHSNNNEEQNMGDRQGWRKETGAIPYMVVKCLRVGFLVELIGRIRGLKCGKKALFLQTKGGGEEQNRPDKRGYFILPIVPAWRLNRRRYDVPAGSEHIERHSSNAILKPS